jgi:hypothetical protein
MELNGHGFPFCRAAGFEAARVRENGFSLTPMLMA